MFRLLPWAEVVFQVVVQGGSSFQVSVSGPVQLTITQDLVLHDVHSLETAMATDDARVLLYDF